MSSKKHRTKKNKQLKLRNIHTLADAIRSKRFGRKALVRLNVGIKNMRTGCIPAHRTQLGTCTLDGSGVMFILNASKKPLQYLKTYDTSNFRFFQMKSVMGVCDTCDECLPAKCLQRCGGCKITEYCSRACQKSQWKQHKADCTLCIDFEKGKSVGVKRIRIKNPLKDLFNFI